MSVSKHLINDMGDMDPQPVLLRMFYHEVDDLGALLQGSEGHLRTLARRLDTQGMSLLCKIISGRSTDYG